MQRLCHWIFCCGLLIYNSIFRYLTRCQPDYMRPTQSFCKPHNPILHDQISHAYTGKSVIHFSGSLPMQYTVLRNFDSVYGTETIVVTLISLWVSKCSFWKEFTLVIRSAERRSFRLTLLWLVSQGLEEGVSPFLNALWYIRFHCMNDISESF